MTQGSTADHVWASVITFVVITYAVTCALLLLLRGAAQSGSAQAFWIFILVTVWSPTFVALLTALLFHGRSAVHELLRLLFSRPARPMLWYVAAAAVPAVVVSAAIATARALHEAAGFIPLAAWPVTIAIQAGTGAAGEELGWRGFWLSQLQSELSNRQSADGRDVELVASVCVFLSRNAPNADTSSGISHRRRRIRVPSCADFYQNQAACAGDNDRTLTFNLGLAIGGAKFGANLWWTLAAFFSIVAVWIAVGLGEYENKQLFS